MKRTLVVLSLLWLAGCASQKVPQDQSALSGCAPLIFDRTGREQLAVCRGGQLHAEYADDSSGGKGLSHVFPVNTVKVVLEQEGMYEPERIRQADPRKLASYFGADAILYVAISRWDAQYAVLSTTVTVQLDYRLVSRNGEELWRAGKQLQYTPQTSSTGSPLADLVVAAVSAAVTKAAPDDDATGPQGEYDGLPDRRHGLAAGPRPESGE